MTSTETSARRLATKLVVTAEKFVPTPVSVILYSVSNGLAAEYMPPEI